MTAQPRIQSTLRTSTKLVYAATYEEHVRVQRDSMIQRGRCVRGRHGLGDAPIPCREGKISIWDERFDIFKHGTPVQQVLAGVALTAIASAVAYAAFEPVLQLFANLLS